MLEITGVYLTSTRAVGAALGAWTIRLGRTPLVGLGNAIFADHSPEIFAPNAEALATSRCAAKSRVQEPLDQPGRQGIFIIRRRAT